MLSCARGDYPAKLQFGWKMAFFMPIESPICVWIVDDSRPVRESLVFLLETAGLQTRAYESAADFLKEFNSGSADFLIIDQNMPEMTGIEVLDHLSERQALPPTVMITGRFGSSVEKRAIEAGALAVLSKPVDSEQLISLIETRMLNAP